MKMRVTIAILTASALSACGSQADQSEDVAVSEAPTLAPEVTAEAAVITEPQPFVNALAASDTFEIEAGKLAQELGTSQAVKDFGAMMVRDHTKSSADLKSAVATAGNGLALAPEMTPQQRSNLEALRNAGERFDAVYQDQQIAAHEAALAVLRGYATSGTVDPLKTFAGQTASVVEGHLDHARNLN